MILPSVEQMQEMDRAAVEELGLPSICLMENAGRGCADLLAERIRRQCLRWPALLCGTGNNGGDGYVIARMLANRGIPVTVYAVGKPESLKGDAAIARTVVERMGLETIPVCSEADLPDLRDHDLLIDCLLGTGLKGGAQKLVGALIRLVTDSGVPVVAIDIPSGVQGDTGLALGPAVVADETLTMAAPKRGLWLQPGRELAGRVSVVDIGYDPTLLDNGDEWELLETRALAALLPRRHSGLHKGQAGHVLVLAGSTGMTGAAILACRAAMRSGAGLVKLVLPASLTGICATALTETITVSLPDEGRGRLGKAHLAALRPELEWADAILVGSGLGRDTDTLELVRALVPLCSKPLVLDADALEAYAGRADELEPEGPLCLTPHPGELRRLLGQPSLTAHHALVEAAADLAGANELTVVLKGGPTVILGSDRSARVNPTGNHGMATAGSGDVLAGLLAGLLAQGCESDDAPGLAVWLHGRAGDLAAARSGARSLLAGDLVDHLAAALKDLEPGA
jgi:hydroxyethylthiazole kinase-like uncharacterized protein yjeF